MKTNYIFITNMIGLQGIKIVSTNVNNGILQVVATSMHDFAVCPICKRITQTVHDSRCQAIKHLPIWGMDTIIMLNKKRFVCD